MAASVPLAGAGTMLNCSLNMPTLLVKESVIGGGPLLKVTDSSGTSVMKP